MTNFEKIKKALDEEGFVKKIRELHNSSVSHSIDWVQWLKSENEDFSCFIKNIGRGIILPSEYEVKSFHNEYTVKNGDSSTPTLKEVSEFYDRALRPCFITDVLEMVGQPYASVIEISNGRSGKTYSVVKVPLWNILCEETTADSIIRRFKEQSVRIVGKFDYENAKISERGQREAVYYIANFSFDEMYNKALNEA